LSKNIQTMIFQTEITLQAYRKGCHLITREILQHLPVLPEKGLLHLFLKHTSAALTINENADPDVQTDLFEIFSRLVPENQPYYEHTLEGSDDMPAHAKSTLSGVSLLIPITNGHLNLGIWQGIYLCEFRNRGGNRTLVATIIS
jgi:secondary thiamine-phosphate synthase enzyme